MEMEAKLTAIIRFENESESNENESESTEKESMVDKNRK